MIARLLVLAFLILTSYLQPIAQQPGVLLLDTAHLASLKKRTKEPKLQPLITNLKKEADKLLTMKPVSVMDKAFTPVSGNKHDYMSQAPYWWYDSSKPNGQPYIRRDGERNPEILKITDRKNISELENATNVLGLAYYLTKDEKYAAKSAQLLRHWFFNAATKMNPNLDYAQSVPGVNTGRGIGIIETMALPGIADASILLNGSASWSDKDEVALKEWYSQYLIWMLTSKNGKEEKAAKNNHGTFYDMQVVDFALFTGNQAVAKTTLEESKRRMELQIDEEGKMALELERTQALWYSTFNLEAWFKLAKLAEFVEADLWNHTTAKNSGIKKALDWLAPYAVGEKKWTYQQIEPYRKENIYVLFRIAEKKFKDNQYAILAAKTKVKLKDPVLALFYTN